MLKPSLSGLAKARDVISPMCSPSACVFQVGRNSQISYHAAAPVRLQASIRTLQARKMTPPILGSKLANNKLQQQGQNNGLGKS